MSSIAIDLFWNGASEAALRLRLTVNIALDTKVTLYIVIEPGNIKQLSVDSEQRSPITGNVLNFDLSDFPSLVVPERPFNTDLDVSRAAMDLFSSLAAHKSFTLTLSGDVVSRSDLQAFCEAAMKTSLYTPKARAITKSFNRGEGGKVVKGNSATWYRCVEATGSCEPAPAYGTPPSTQGKYLHS